MSKATKPTGGPSKADIRALLGGMGIEPQRKKAVAYTPLQERVIAGFEDVQRFVAEHGREPRHGEDRDIFERLYAVRLDRIRQSTEWMALLADFDADGLLTRGAAPAGEAPRSRKELLAAMGIAAGSAGGNGDLTTLKNVRPDAERKSPDAVAQRTPCADFDQFRPLFEAVQAEIASGARRTVSFKGRDNQAIEVGDWFVLDGQKALVATAGKAFKQDYGETDRRMRVVFDNGVESPMLMRSLRRALNNDEQSRRILPPDANVGPLFSGELDEGDLPSGTIYVLRSLSDHPFVAEHRTLIHKIGVTGGDVKRRIANARKDPTYLLADVEVLREYQLANVGRRALEALLHKIFGGARLDLELKDRFGEKVEPHEWYLVPLPAVEEAIRRITDGTIEGFRYDAESARLIPV